MGNIIICECFRKDDKKNQHENLYESRITSNTKIIDPEKIPLGLINNKSSVPIINTELPKKQIVKNESLLTYTDSNSEYENKKNNNEKNEIRNNSYSLNKLKKREREYIIKNKIYEKYK
jgi:hypothetical protein